MSYAACLAAAVLAGGRARRLGGIDKSSLTIGGQPILDRVLAAVRPVTAQVFAVGDRHGAAGRAGLTIVDDLLPGAGALGGIYTAITTSPCERTLVIGCDMPFLRTEFLAWLAGIDGDVVMPRSTGGLEPLCAVYSRRCAEPIRERLERGDRRAAVLPDGVRAVVVGPDALAAYDPEGLLFVNVNTPHDYKQARRQLDPDWMPDGTTDD